jgi:hypothetical protein
VNAQNGAGTALDFDGISTFVRAPGADYWPGLTVEAWVKPKNLYLPSDQNIARQGQGPYASGEDWVIGFIDHGSRLFFGLRVMAGIGSFNYSYDFPYINRDDFMDGRWHHIAGTFDGTMLRLSR